MNSLLILSQPQCTSYVQSCQEKRLAPSLLVVSALLFPPPLLSPATPPTLSLLLPGNVFNISNMTIEGLGLDLSVANISVENIDSFTNPKSSKTSNCYRVTYRSMDRSLTNDEINALQDALRDEAAATLGVELR